LEKQGKQWKTIFKKRKGKRKQTSSFGIKKYILK
jgi:hypothetical protein